MSLSSRPFSAATTAQLEGEYYRYHERLSQHIANLLHAVKTLGDDPPARLGTLLREQSSNPDAAAQLATVTWPLLQAYESLVGALDRAARLSGAHPSLKSVTAREVIDILRDSGQVPKPVVDALTTLNRWRNDLVHEFASVGPPRLLETLKMMFRFGRYTDSFGKLLVAADLTPP